MCYVMRLTISIIIFLSVESQPPCLPLTLQHCSSQLCVKYYYNIIETERVFGWTRLRRVPVYIVHYIGNDVVVIMRATIRHIIIIIIISSLAPPHEISVYIMLVYWIKIILLYNSRGAKSEIKLHHNCNIIMMLHELGSGGFRSATQTNNK